MCNQHFYPNIAHPYAQQFNPNIAHTNAQQFNSQHFNVPQFNANIPHSSIQQLNQNSQPLNAHAQQSGNQSTIQSNASNETNRTQNISRSLNRTSTDEPRTIFLKRLNNIPEFDGESFESLKKFLKKSEALLKCCTNDADINGLYEQILLRVNSETRELIISLQLLYNKKYSNASFQSFIQQKFNYYRA